MQTEEVPILEILDQQRMSAGVADFRDLNGALGDLTNLILGSLKDCYMGDADNLSVSRVQVPLLINHKQKYISFGSENPQLCFVYRVMDDLSGRHFDLHQRLIFSLSWSPDEFREFDQGVDVYGHKTEYLHRGVSSISPLLGSKFRNAAERRLLSNVLHPGRKQSSHIAP